MAKRRSPLAAAFVWAVVAGASCGIGAILHESADHVASDAGLAAGVAGVVAYSERKRIPYI